MAFVDRLQLKSFFQWKRVHTDRLTNRGPSLPINSIAKDDRYLIAERACKSYGDKIENIGDLMAALLVAYEDQVAKGIHSVKIRNLLDGEVIKAKYAGRQEEFIFSADDVLEETVTSREEISEKYEKVAKVFFSSRQLALDNTKLYLSMVGELDVYVATSMRSRDDFRNMASTCERIFSDSRLGGLNLRYFDPTLSAAMGHEDKGLIECLMVKCAKVLVYCAGDKESWGKDAEAAMALSQGKPVIFYCDKYEKSRFYRDVHPLSRLIEFNTGIAVGAIVTDKIEDVPELINRILRNRMEYRLERREDGYLKLIEKITNSVVRLQTSDQLLNETFWNHYHGADRSR